MDKKIRFETVLNAVKLTTFCRIEYWLVKTIWKVEGAANNTTMNVWLSSTEQIQYAALSQLFMIVYAQKWSVSDIEIVGLSFSRSY